jgi:hypothetical protein
MNNLKNGRLVITVVVVLSVIALAVMVGFVFGVFG